MLASGQQQEPGRARLRARGGAELYGGRAVQSDIACEPANAQPSAANARAQPAPSRPPRQPGPHAGQPHCQRRGQHPGADRHDREEPAAARARARAVCRRSSAASASSARRRSDSICARSRSMRARSRSNASFSAATTTPARRVSSPRAAVSGTSGYAGSSVAPIRPPIRASPLTVSGPRIQLPTPMSPAYGQPDLAQAQPGESLAESRSVLLGNRRGRQQALSKPAATRSHAGLIHD